MDVSKREAQDMEPKGTLTDSSLEGESLIQTLVTLTGLPEGMAHEELDQILSMSGHQPENRSDLTLEELRAALINYLEALQPSCSD